MGFAGCGRCVSSRAVLEIHVALCACTSCSGSRARKNGIAKEVDLLGRSLLGSGAPHGQGRWPVEVEQQELLQEKHDLEQLVSEARELAERAETYRSCASSATSRIEERLQADHDRLRRRACQVGFPPPVS